MAVKSVLESWESYGLRSTEKSAFCAIFEILTIFYSWMEHTPRLPPFLEVWDRYLSNNNIHVWQDQSDAWFSKYRTVLFISSVWKNRTHFYTPFAEVCPAQLVTTMMLCSHRKMTWASYSSTDPRQGHCRNGRYI